MVLNYANHYAGGVLQLEAEWHVSVLLAIGWELLHWEDVKTQRYGYGANSDLRAPEQLIVFGKPGGPAPDWVWQPPAERRSGHLWDIEPEPVQLQLFAGDRP